MSEPSDTMTSSWAWEGFLSARLALIQAWAKEGEHAARICQRLNSHDPTQIQLLIDLPPDGGSQQRRIEWLSRELQLAVDEREARISTLLDGNTTALFEKATAEMRCPLDGYPLVKQVNTRLTAHVQAFELACRCGFSFTE